MKDIAKNKCGNAGNGMGTRDAVNQGENISIVVEMT